MPVFMLIFCILAVLVLLLYVVLRLNELEKEISDFVARTIKHYESR